MNKIFLIITFFTMAIARESDTPVPIKEGNFSVAGSQQPSPLFGFGQNIIDKGDLQFFNYADYIKIKKSKYANVVPSFLYGIRDDLSIFVAADILAKYRNGEEQGHAMGSFFAQLEYAYFVRAKKHSTKQFTVLAAISAPNGAAIKQPIVGQNSSSIFLGGTFQRTDPRWYMYTSYGALFGVSKTEDDKPGINFYYQGGLGRNYYTSQNWISLILLEFLGFYSKQDMVNGSMDQNSGGNIILLAPSLWFSSERIIFQFGIGFPIFQNLFGDQEKYDFQIGVNFAWKF